jgi:hypothetical protein
MRMAILGSLLLLLSGTQGRTEWVASAVGNIGARMTMPISFDDAISERRSRHSPHWKAGSEWRHLHQRHRDVGKRFRYPYRVGDPELCEPSRWTFATRGRAAHRPCWPHVWTCRPPERNWCFIQRP